MTDSLHLGRPQLISCFPLLFFIISSFSNHRKGINRHDNMKWRAGRRVYRTVDDDDPLICQYPRRIFFFSQEIKRIFNDNNNKKETRKKRVTRMDDNKETTKSGDSFAPSFKNWRSQSSEKEHTVSLRLHLSLSLPVPCVFSMERVASFSRGCRFGITTEQLKHTPTCLHPGCKWAAVLRNCCAATSDYKLVGKAAGNRRKTVFLFVAPRF